MIIQTFAAEYYICFFNMDTTKTTAVLFDFDGVVMDTETQYSVFWHKAGVDYLALIAKNKMNETMPANLELINTVLDTITARNPVAITQVHARKKNRKIAISVIQSIFP